MRILVCGGRNFNDYDFLRNTLDKFCVDRGLVYDDEYQMPSGVTIIHGKARGADLMADQWAVVNWVPIEEYPAEWDKYGKSAGYIRNQRMLDEGKPDVVIAFPGGKGTEMMKRIAEKAGVEVISVSP